MINLMTIEDLEVILAGQEEIKVQKVINKNERVYNRSRIANTKIFLIGRKFFAKQQEKEIEVWQENSYEWTVRLVSAFTEDTEEFKVKKLREKVA